MEKEGREIFVSGRVQGVGYRFFTQNLISKYPGVFGYSMNLPDGRVILELEGTPEDLDKICEELSEGPGRIDTVIVNKKTYTGKFKKFSIKQFDYGD